MCYHPRVHPQGADQFAALFDHHTPPTWGIIRRLRFRRKIRQLKELLYVFNFLTWDTDMDDFSEYVATPQYMFKPTVLQRFGKNPPQYDSIDFALTQIVRSMMDQKSEYTTMGFKTRTVTSWEQMYLDTMPTQSWVDQHIQEMLIYDVNTGYHPDHDPRKAADVSRSTPYAVLILNCETFGVQDDTPIVHGRSLQNAVEALLLWLNRHGKLLEGLNMLANNAGTGEQYLARYGASNANISLALHLVTAFKHALQQFTVSPDTPWEWQEPLLLQSFLEQVNNADRMRYMFQGTHNIFFAGRNILWERHTIA